MSVQGEVLSFFQVVEKAIQQITNKTRLPLHIQRTKIMKGTRKEHIVENIKYLGLDAVAEAYRENKVTLDTIYKRHQRGKRGDDLIPEKKRMGYIEPVKESKPGFTIGGIKYKSEADACRKLDVKYGTYKKRQRRGWDNEEALGLKTRTKAKTRPQAVELAETKEGELPVRSECKNKIAKKRNKHKTVVAFDKNYKNIKQLADAFGMEYSLVYNRIHYSSYTPERAVTQKKKGIKITLNGKEFSSMVEAAEYHNINVETASRRLKAGAPVDQAFGLETYRTSKSVEYQGVVYPSLKALAEELGLNCYGLYKAMRKEGRNLEKAVERLRHTSPKGRKSKTYFQKNPEAGNSPAWLYLANLTFKDIAPTRGKQFVKVGISSDLQDRSRTLGCVNNFELTSKNTYRQAEAIESKVKEEYKGKKTEKLSARHLDGFSEVFELTNDQCDDLIKFINANLQQSALN